MRSIAIPVLIMAFSVYRPVFATPPPADEAAIHYLLEAVRKSEVRFLRNGSVHDPATAAAHIERKYQKGRERIVSAEDFIERVASRSIRTGEAYVIRYPDGKTQPVGEYLLELLAKYRATLNTK